MKRAVVRLLGDSVTRRLTLWRKGALIAARRVVRALGGRRPAPLLPFREFSLAGHHLFFGYYDLSQMSGDGNLLLAMATPPLNRTPPAGARARLGFFDLRQGDGAAFKEFASTGAWCWQQGCRLQWYPAAGSTTVIHNDLGSGGYRALVRDVQDGRVVREYARPLYAVSGDGHWGLSLDFSRLQRLRPGYGYSGVPDASVCEKAPGRDGVWRIDMESGEEKLLFSLREIASLLPDARSAAGEHVFNHLLFSPRGDRFIFFHICHLPGGARRIRLFTSDLEGRDLRLRDGGGSASHYNWVDGDRLLYTSATGNGVGYFLQDDRTGEREQVGAGVLREDGHPTFLAGGRFIVTDSYPDRFGDQTVLLYDRQNGRLTPLGRHRASARFAGEMRCDLHPRVCGGGASVAVDCIRNGRRVMRMIDLLPSTGGGGAG